MAFHWVIRIPHCSLGPSRIVYLSIASNRHVQTLIYPSKTQKGNSRTTAMDFTNHTIGSQYRTEGVYKELFERFSSTKLLQKTFSI